MTVSLVVVSHSAALADGVVELAGQMASAVNILPAGGSDDGGIGTSFDKVSSALSEATQDGGDAVVLYDLGSALLTTETALEFLDPDVAARIEVVDAALAEGAIAAAVAAQGGADRAGVAAAARSAVEPQAAAQPTNQSPEQAGGERREVRLVNPLGLHARPAADLAGALRGLDARVWVARPDGTPVELTSVLGVVRLALRGGQTAVVNASGPDAGEALERVVQRIDGGFGEADEPAATASGPRTPPTAAPRGPQPASGGPALGPLAHAGTVEVADRPGTGADAERQRLDRALAVVADRLERGDALSRAHAALLRDPGLRAGAEPLLGQDRAAASAWWAAVSEQADELASSSDELVAGRAVDLREAGAAVLAELGEHPSRLPQQLTGAVLEADELGPGEIGAAAERGVAGIVLRAGSPTMHAVVVARGLGLPLVIRAGDLLADVPAGTPVALDGSTGTVDVDPGDAERWRAAVDQSTRAADDARAAVGGPLTVAGRPILLAANVSSVAEARAAVANGARAVGLLRTELLVLDRDVLPDEDEQTADLQQILDVLGDRPVVVRVLDPGGDKPVRALDLDERHNGFLGVRGLRWLLAHPDVLQTQLRAISRAAAGHRVSVMAPMVSTPAEARAFRDAVSRALVELRRRGVAHAEPEAVGVMVEVPAAALSAAELGEVIDFVSIGTNDLTSYTMAADRTEPGVADLLEPVPEAVWRLIGLVSAEADVPVAVCGELAGDPDAAARLVRLGVDELSMAPARIPAVAAALHALRSDQFDDQPDDRPRDSDGGGERAGA